jgi:hypothetical protein
MVRRNSCSNASAAGTPSSARLATCAPSPSARQQSVGRGWADAPKAYSHTAPATPESIRGWACSSRKTCCRPPSVTALGAECSGTATTALPPPQRDFANPPHTTPKAVVVAQASLPAGEASIPARNPISPRLRETREFGSCVANRPEHGQGYSRDSSPPPSEPALDAERYGPAAPASLHPDAASPAPTHTTPKAVM